jgi:hypothetical protein
VARESKISIRFGPGAAPLARPAAPDTTYSGSSSLPRRLTEAGEAECELGPRNAETRLAGGLHEERMMGLEPTTFCMAKRSRDADWL